MLGGQPNNWCDPCDKKVSKNRAGWDPWCLPDVGPVSGLLQDSGIAKQGEAGRDVRLSA